MKPPLSGHQIKHELPKAGTALRPELARSGLLNSMTGKVFRKIGGDKYGKQCKKSAYMGKKEVWERNWLI